MHTRFMERQTAAGHGGSGLRVAGVAGFLDWGFRRLEHVRFRVEDLCACGNTLL